MAKRLIFADRQLQQFLTFGPTPSRHLQPSTSRGAALVDFFRDLFARKPGILSRGLLAPVPLLEAVMADDIAEVVQLLAADPDCVRATNQQGLAALHLAIAAGRMEIVRALLDAGCPVDFRDAWNNTPLHWAVFVADEECSTLLAAGGADATAVNHLGGTPTEYAMALGEGAQDAADAEPVRVLDPQAGIIASWPPQRIVDALGFTPIANAVIGNDFIYEVFFRCRFGEVKLRRVRQLPCPGSAPAIHLENYASPLGWGVAVSAGAAADDYLGSMYGSVERVVIDGNEDSSYWCDIGPAREFLRLLIVGDISGSPMTRANSSRDRATATMSVVYGWRRGLPVLDFYARRDLVAGEQLTWYYGEGYWRAKGVAPS